MIILLHIVTAVAKVKKFFFLIQLRYHEKCVKFVILIAKLAQYLIILLAFLTQLSDTQPFITALYSMRLYVMSLFIPRCIINNLSLDDFNRQFFFCFFLEYFQWSVRSNSTPGGTKDVWTDTEKESDDIVLSERSDSGVTSPNNSHHHSEDPHSVSPCDLSVRYNYFW